MVLEKPSTYVQYIYIPHTHITNFICILYIYLFNIYIMLFRQIIATSHDLSPNSGLGRFFLFIMMWPDIYIYISIRTYTNTHDDTCVCVCIYPQKTLTHPNDAGWDPKKKGDDFEYSPSPCRCSCFKISIILKPKGWDIS